MLPQSGSTYDTHVFRAPLAEAIRKGDLHELQMQLSTLSVSDLNRHYRAPMPVLPKDASMKTQYLHYGPLYGATIAHYLANLPANAGVPVAKRIHMIHMLAKHGLQFDSLDAWGRPPFSRDLAVMCAIFRYASRSIISIIDQFNENMLTRAFSCESLYPSKAPFIKHLAEADPTPAAARNSPAYDYCVYHAAFKEEDAQLSERYIKMMLYYGLSANARCTILEEESERRIFDPTEEPVIHQLIKENKKALFDLFCEQGNGLALDACDKNGNSVLDVARRTKCPEVFDWVLAAITRYEKTYIFDAFMSNMSKREKCSTDRTEHVADLGVYFRVLAIQGDRLPRAVEAAAIDNQLGENTKTLFLSAGPGASKEAARIKPSQAPEPETPVQVDPWQCTMRRY